MRIKVILFLFLALSFLSLRAQEETPKHHKRQFRGVWIATVRNLDWPSEPGLSVRKMKKEYIAQLELLRSLGMNAVIVQIRPSGDALYPSDYEPWSQFLSGQQGKPPSRSFDPLKFMIEETHKRCMEFHAWFNPYRGVRDFENTIISADHIIHKYPNWFVQYGNHLYFDPGIVPARKFVEKVIADVVYRYDIDAVHFDDYYYPYRLDGLAFPDTLSFRLYHGKFQEENKDDWRRENINLLVSELNDTINLLKPWVHFGISPFGVWRNKSRDARGSETETLQTNYDDLFGDAIAWMSNGWLDYILPQCYQYLGRRIMDYRVVTKWWNDNHYDVNFYIGQGPFRLGTTERGNQWSSGNEIDRQLKFNDSIPDLLGSAYFRSLTFMDNPLGVNDILKSKYYRFPALPPVSHHDKNKSAEFHITAMKVKNTAKKIKISWKTDKPDFARYYVIYSSPDIQNPENIIGSTAENEFKFYKKNTGADINSLFLTVVDKFRNESVPIQINLK